VTGHSRTRIIRRRRLTQMMIMMAAYLHLTWPTSPAMMRITASPIDQMREEQCPEWIDDTDDSSAISRHSCSHPTVPPRNARERESHAVIKSQATTSESSDEDEQTYVISKILTQNAHGLRRRARNDDGNLRPNSPPDYTRYEHLITTMKLKDIDVYFVQETWPKEMSLMRS
jgi:hypothetical protein